MQIRQHRLWLALWGQGFLLLSAPNAQTPANGFETDVRPILARHCFQCHGDKTQMAGVNFAAFRNSAEALKEAELWKKVRERISAHQMPPAPLPGLSVEDTATITGWVASLPGVPRTSLHGPGRITARRLNRAEYDHTIRDFLGVTVHPGEEFPVDNQGYGFDNIGDVLTLSPMLMEKYMAAARSVSRIAVYGELYEKKPGLVGKLLTKSVQDDGQVTGNVLHFSMRGDLEGVFHFPVEADYVLQFRITNRRGVEPGVDLSPNGGGGRGAGRAGGRGPRVPLTEAEKSASREADRLGAPPVDLNVDVDGRQVLKSVIEGNEAFDYSRGPTVVKIHVPAGDHTIHAYFPANADLDDPRTNLNARDGRRRLAAEFVEILGPYNPSTARPTSYDKIFVCAGRDADCARKIVESLARRGFRRPPTEAEVQQLMKLVNLVRKQGDSFEEGIRIALQSILVSPAFLFRIERDAASGDRAYRVNDYELASRLSYFLWGTMPDDELLSLADQRRLGRSYVLEGQVQRILRDAKATNLVDQFASQWLDLRALDRKKPDALRFPTVDDELLAAMRRETLLFVGEIFHEDRSLLELIDGKFTYVNGPLARYYRIPGVNGVKFQRVSLEGSDRGGLLTQASVLTLTSYATRTSPVIRGKWVLDTLLGAAPPPPPPGIPALEEKNLGKDASVHTRLEQHRADAACAACHAQMDPIGFGLENFDAAGGFRTTDGNFDVDSSGTLPDGRTFRGANELRSLLKSQSAEFTRNLSERMLTFALGRGIETPDKATVDRINQTLMANGNRLSVLVMAIVQSEPFQMREKEEVAHASR